MIQTEYEMDNPNAFRHSKDLFKMPQEAGLAIMRNGKMSLCDTYAGENRLEDYSNLRTYMGHYFFNKKDLGKYKTTQRYPLFFNPEKKVNLKDVFEVYRFRYEGTEYCPETSGRNDIRLIGTEAQFNVHAIQIHHDLQPEVGSVVWIAIANSEHSIFLPYSSLLTKTDPRLDVMDQMLKKINSKDFLNDVEDKPILYSEDLAQVCFKRLCLIAEHDRDLYGKGVRDYWDKKEKKLVKEFPKVLKNASKLADKSLDDAIDYMNDYSLKLTDETIEEAKTIFNQLI